MITSDRATNGEDTLGSQLPTTVGATSSNARNSSRVQFWSEPSLGRAYSVSLLLTFSAMIGAGVESVTRSGQGWKEDVAAAGLVQLGLTALSIICSFTSILNCCLPKSRQIPEVRLRDSALITSVRADVLFPVVAQFALVQWQVSDSHVSDNGYYPLLATIIGLAILLTLAGVTGAVAIGVDSCCYKGRLTSAASSYLFGRNAIADLQEPLVNADENCDVDEESVVPSIDGTSANSVTAKERSPASYCVIS